MYNNFSSIDYCIFITYKYKYYYCSDFISKGCGKQARRVLTLWGIYDNINLRLDAYIGIVCAIRGEIVEIDLRCIILYW